MTIRDAAELLLLAALWGASFLCMRLGAAEFGPLALDPSVEVCCFFSGSLTPRAQHIHTHAHAHNTTPNRCPAVSTRARLQRL